MSYRFVKGHGTENDFVLLPDHDGTVHGDLSPDRVRALCDRRSGIGADGVLRVIRSQSLPSARSGPSTPEWFMDHRNSDGSLAQMCGNGIRVFAKHLYDEGLVPRELPARILTRAGVKTVSGDGELFTVDMGVATVRGETKVSVDDRTWLAVHVDTGNPHAVAMVDDLAEVGPLADPPAYDTELYPEGVNVEFVVRRGPDHLAMRVHERGSGETRSCGTGACAAAVAASGYGPWQVRVDVPGGSLTVSHDEAGCVFLTGPAMIVASGTTDL